MPRKSLPPEYVAEIVRRRNKGEDSKIIGASLGISASRVRTIYSAETRREAFEYNMTRKAKDKND